LSKVPLAVQTATHNLITNFVYSILVPPAFGEYFRRSSSFTFLYCWQLLLLV